MQGGQGQGGGRQDPLDRSATAGFRRSDITGGQRRLPDTTEAQRAIERHRLAEMTGEHRAMPKRPAGMTHLDQPPATPRVARPQPEVRQPKRRGKRLLIWVIALVIGIPLIFAIAFGITNFFLAVNVTAGAASKATDFLTDLQNANYTQAYGDLDATITSFQLSQASFTQKAQADDHCYGQVTGYSEVSGSATVSSDGNTQSYAYTITRNKLKQPYQLSLTMHKDPDGDWTITSYGTDLGPAPPTCQ